MFDADGRYANMPERQLGGGRIKADDDQPALPTGTKIEQVYRRAK
jgi:hypothetical protein